MSKIALRGVTALLLVSFLASSSLAQRGKSDPVFSPRRQLATIIFTGLGGAVLGLSTLSFYGRPQDHLDNIGTGFALGIIAGTGLMTYNVLSVSDLDRLHNLDGEPEMYQAHMVKVPTQIHWTWQF